MSSLGAAGDLSESTSIVNIMVIRYDSNLCHGKSCHETGFYIMVSNYRKGKASCHPTLEFK